jgi:hypothetical protein
MGKLRLSSAFLLIAALGQAERFDIINFTPPSGWNREVQKSSIAFVFVDQAKKQYCQIQVFASRAGGGPIESELQREWKEAVLSADKKAEGYSKPIVNELPNGVTLAQQMAPMRFAQGTYMATLSVYQKNGRVVSVLVNVPDEAAFNRFFPQISAFLQSVSLDAPAVAAPGPTAGSAPGPVTSSAAAPISGQGLPVAPATPAQPYTGDPNTLSGPWRRGTASYNSRYNPLTKQWEYQPLQQQFRIVTEVVFEPNGTYINHAITTTSKIIMNESGTYTVNGRVLNLRPTAYESSMEFNKQFKLGNDPVPAPYQLEWYIGEHPQYKDNQGLQLRSGSKWIGSDNGQWVTFRRPQ